MGSTRMFRWFKCVPDEGFMQVVVHMYRKMSGVFMGTSPVPNIANDFAFWHVFEFLLHIIYSK